MRRTLRRVWADERGVVMVLALIILGTLSALAVAYSMMVGTDTLLRGGSARMRDGFYAAEAGLNIGMAEFANVFKDYNVPTVAGGDFEPREVTVGSRTVHYQLEPVPGYDPCTEGEDEGCFTRIPAGEKFAGLMSIPYRYTVKATSENIEGDQEANLGAEFDVQNIPIFQFLAFYAGDLEIFPGPPMDLHGRIHTNGNLYLGAGDRLTVSDSLQVPNVQVSAGGNIYHWRKDGSSCGGGAVTIDRLADTSPHDGSYDPLTMPGCAGNPLSRAALDAYLGSVFDQAANIQVPPVGVIERGGDGVFWQHADLRVVLRLDQPGAAIDFGVAGLCPGGPGTLTSPALFPIEVQNADGSPNGAKTNALQQFMCERRGALFYNDVPVNPPATPSSNVGFFAQAANYNPPFTSNNRVYRRVGEDTGGDGIIDRSGDAVISNNDRNDAICPFGNGASPWWRPDFCTLALGAWPNPGPPPDTSWFADSDYRRGGFYNNREKKWVYLLNVNMRALIEWNEVNGDPLFPYNDTTQGGLVVFLSVQGPYSTSSPSSSPVRYGVRVFDSADLDTRDVTFPPNAEDPTGLTLVSDQAIYIEGNYNYKDKYPAAVIGDTVNVLSQSWEVRRTNASPVNDQKTAAALSSHDRDVFNNDGNPTTNTNCPNNACRAFNTSTALGINAAFIAGVDVTGSGYDNYNGGLENYPRFHEDWGGSSSGRTLNYRGSYVSLGTPRHANGKWCGTGTTCNIYNPPQRPWDFDADFGDVRNLPPLTPKVTYVQQRIYTRFYK